MIGNFWDKLLAAIFSWEGWLRVTFLINIIIYFVTKDDFHAFLSVFAFLMLLDDKG